MTAAGKEMAEFVGEKDGEEGESERQAGKQRGGVFVEEREGADEFVNGGGLLVGVGGGELRAGHEAGGEGAKKERDSEQQGAERRVREDGSVKVGSRRESAPVDLRDGIENGVWRLRAHESRGPKNSLHGFVRG